MKKTTAAIEMMGLKMQRAVQMGDHAAFSRILMECSAAAARRAKARAIKRLARKMRFDTAELSDELVLFLTYEARDALERRFARDAEAAMGRCTRDIRGDAW